MMSDRRPIVPKSAVTGIGWPAIPERGTAIKLALLYQLEQSQWWDGATLQKYQFAQLGRVVAHARETVPLWRDRFAANGFTPAATLSAAAWSTLPPLSRSALQTAGQAILSAKPPAAHGRIGQLRSSGSTGRPVTVFTTGVTRLFWEVFTLREMLWHKRDLLAKIAAIRYLAAGRAPPPDGQRSPSWSLTGDLALPTGPGSLLNITAKIGEQADWLCRENPDYLLTYPSNLADLADHFQAKGFKLPRLREVSTLGEIVTPKIRQRCRDVFGVKLVDIYSCREAGYLALQCPLHDHYHVQSENVLLEVLDGANRPCRPGEVGRVVISTLQNYASPLFRYELGDYAEVGDPCPCGRGLPVLRRILGRVRNMLTFPDGGRVWPIFDIAAFEKVAPLRQWQIVQKTLEELEVRLVPLRPFTVEEEQAFTQVVAQSLGHPFRCKFVYFHEIPRSAGGKYEDFQSEVTPSAAIAERPNP